MSLSFQQYSIPELKFSEIQLAENYTYDVHAKWETLKPDPYRLIEMFGEPIASIINDDTDEYAILYNFEDIEGEKGVALMDFGKRSISVSMAALSRKTIDVHLSMLKNLYEPEPEQVDGKVKVRFWYNTNHGPKNVIRSIAVPKWDQIINNYAPPTLTSLEYLIKEFKPTGGGGQLIIMNGVPGTGKSYYLRSLLHAWKDWCTAEYVLDPENLFGGNNQGYIADLVLKNAYDEEYDYLENDQENADKWKLLILEDCGDLLKIDANQHVGTAGLARLLNLVDGLIGQGLRVLVLITTNEDFEKMNPAVIRDGRTAATITFTSLSREHASSWLNGSTPKLPEGKTHFTLAELYALVKGKSIKRLEESRGFGFKMP